MIFYSVARENGVPQIKGTKEQQQAAKNDAEPAAMVLADKLWRNEYLRFFGKYNVLTMKNINRDRSSRFQNRYALTWYKFAAMMIASSELLQTKPWHSSCFWLPCLLITHAKMGGCGLSAASSTSVSDSKSWNSLDLSRPSGSLMRGKNANLCSMRPPSWTSRLWTNFTAAQTAMVGKGLKISCKMRKTSSLTTIPSRRKRPSNISVLLPAHPYAIL